MEVGAPGIVLSSLLLEGRNVSGCGGGRGEAC